MDEKLNNLIKKYNNNKDNSKIEINIHNLKLLEKYRNDDLYFLIETAVERGYVGAEWIDFNGIGGIDIDTCVNWVYGRIKEQKLECIIEPYYNNINQRLGIIIMRNKLKVNKKPLCLPLELQDKNKKVVKIEIIKEEISEPFIRLNSCKITNPSYENKKKKSRIRRLTTKLGKIASTLTKSFSGSSINSVKSDKEQTPKN